MTGCARARGDLETFCVDGATGPDARVIGGRSVCVLDAAVDTAKTGGSMLLLRDDGPVKKEPFRFVSKEGRSASVKYADALKSSSVL
jgi:hypothetical protein